MKIFLVYDSEYDYMEEIAQAIQSGFSELHQVEMKHVNASSQGDLSNIDLFIVGSSTQGGRETEDVKTFLDGLSDHVLRGTRAAAFDTSVAEENQGFFAGKITKWFGHASARLEQTLIDKGAEPVLKESFLIQDKAGPLKAGELERAREWAFHLLDR